MIRRGAVRCEAVHHVVHDDVQRLGPQRHGPGKGEVGAEQPIRTVVKRTGHQAQSQQSTQLITEAGVGVERKVRCVLLESTERE
jgi:hypothetical protein